MTQTNKEKIYLLKSTIEFLYCKEGRSKAYIAKLLDVDRSRLTKIINDEWKLEQANIRYMLPSNEKFLNKHRNLIKSRLDKDIQLKDIAKELGVSIDYVTKTIIKQDDVLLKALEDNNNRKKENHNKLVKDAMDKSSYDYNIVDFEDEVWLGILGYDGYMVSNYGRVKSYSKRYKEYHLLTPSTNKNNGRLYVSIKDKNLQVSRLVGFAFVDGYSEENNTIEHEDNNVANNFYANLKWVSQKENNRLAYEKGRKPAISNTKSKHFKKIVLDNEYEFKTIRAFAKFIGKSETQAHRYIFNLTTNNPYEIELIY